MISEHLNIINNHLDTIKEEIIIKLNYYMSKLEFYGIIVENEYNFDETWTYGSYIDMKYYIHGFVTLVQNNPYTYNFDDITILKIPIYIIDFNEKQIDDEFNNIMLSTLNYNGIL